MAACDSRNVDIEMATKKRRVSDLFQERGGLDALTRAMALPVNNKKRKGH